MGSNKNYHFQVDLSQIPFKDGQYVWSKSEGCIVPFKCDLFDGELIVVEHIPKNRKNHTTNSLIVLKYQNEVLRPITTIALKRGKINGILAKFLPSWKYDIGDVIYDKNRNIKIIDKKILDGQRNYKILCLKCGFDSREYYSLVNNVFKSEYWIDETRLKKGAKCPCCGSSPKIVAQGINDIGTTDSWMTEYFTNKYDLLTHTSQSSKKVLMTCPNCGNQRISIIGNLQRRKYLSCECDDCISFPNKLAFYTLKSIPELQNYQREYSPEWVKPYRYDNYFTYNGQEYIIEMDGNVGHGNLQFKSNKKDIDGLQRDIIKDKKALGYNIKLYRVDCTSNNYDIIYNNLYSTLANILGYYPTLDKQMIVSLSTKNIVKEVCNYYSNISNNQKQICDIYKINPTTLIRYLEQGTKFHWCNYKKLSHIKEENKIKAIDLYLSNLSVNEIAEKMKLNYCTIRNYLLEADSDGLCSYNSQLEREIRSKRRTEKSIIASSKRVYMYDMNYNYIAQYKSVNDLERHSVNDFGIELKSRGVGRVCLNQRKHYKGYIFSYTPITNILQPDCEGKLNAC